MESDNISYKYVYIHRYISTQPILKNLLVDNIKSMIYYFFDTFSILVITYAQLHFSHGMRLWKILKKKNNNNNNNSDVYAN